MLLGQLDPTSRVTDRHDKGAWPIRPVLAAATLAALATVRRAHAASATVRALAGQLSPLDRAGHLDVSVRGEAHGVLEETGQDLQSH